jgi:hypothetical protein
MILLEKPIILPMTLKEIQEGNYQFKFGNLTEEWGSTGEAIVIPASAFNKPYDEGGLFPDSLNDIFNLYCDMDIFDNTDTRFKLKQQIVSVWFMISNFGNVLNKFLNLASKELISFKKLKETDKLLFGHCNNSIYIDLSVDDRLVAAEIVVGTGGCKYIEYIEGNELNNRVSSVHTRYIDLDLSKEELGILVNTIFPTLWYYSRNTIDMKELAEDKMKKLDISNLKKDNLKPLSEDLTMEKERSTYKPNYGKESVDSTWKILWTLVKNNIEDLEIQKELIQEMIEAQEKVIEVQKKVMEYLKKAKEEL